MLFRSLFITKDGEEVQLESLKIPKLDHQPIVHPAVKNNNCVTDTPEYYSCANCDRLYKDLALFIANTDNTDSETNYWTDEKELRDQTGHTYVYTFNWAGLAAPEDFKEGEANGVTVVRKCNKVGCSHEETPISISVSEQPVSGFNCLEGGKAIYTAAAKFDKDEHEVTLDKNKEHIQEESKVVDIPALAQHEYQTKFAFGEGYVSVGEGNKLVITPSKVTATRTCTICKEQDPLAEDAAVTVALEQGQNFDPETDTFTCGQEKKLRFIAELRTKDGVSLGNKTDEKGFRASHSLKFKEAKAANCTEKGWHAHYECEICHAKYWDDSTPVTGNGKDKVEIEELGHGFTAPTFSWEGSNPQTSSTAKALFKCMRCQIEVTITGLTVNSEGIYDGEETSITCGDTFDLNYATGVNFNRFGVTEVDGKYVYNKPADKEEIYYPGSVQKKGTLNHDFETALTWNGSATGGYENPAEGLTATITCKNCSKNVVFASTETTDTAKGVVVPNETDDKNLKDATGSMTILKETAGNGYTPVTCEKDGNDVYHITVT